MHLSHFAVAAFTAIMACLFFSTACTSQKEPDSLETSAEGATESANVGETKVVPFRALQIGDQIPAFKLASVVEGKTYSSLQYKDSQLVLVIFTALQCP